MIRMYIHKEAKIIENKDVVVISDEAIAKMKKRYGDDIEERLKAVNMLFEAIPSLRAENPEQLKEIRKLAPHTFFLIPGYGAQGGKAEDIALGFDKNGLWEAIEKSHTRGVEKR